jgi:hypothetical protein
MKTILLAMIVRSALLATPSFAMNFTYSVIGENEDGLSVNMTGEIVFGDANKFFAFAKTLPSLPIKVFILNSPGGIVNEAGIMGDAIRGSKIATAVIDGHTCASACFMLFAAGYIDMLYSMLILPFIVQPTGIPATSPLRHIR